MMMMSNKLYDIDTDCMNHGICFTTPEAAARIGLHIRNALAKAVKP
jgi:hypothetical protein